MKKLGFVLAALGFLGFIFSLIFKNFGIWFTSLQIWSILIYSLGLYLYIVPSLNLKKIASDVVLVVAYSIIWAYSLVSAIAHKPAGNFMILLVILLTLHFILLFIFPEKS